MADCTWCGHGEHGPDCPRKILVQAQGAKKPKEMPCPCSRGKVVDGTTVRSSPGDAVGTRLIQES